MCLDVIVMQFDDDDGWTLKRTSQVALFPVARWYSLPSLPAPCVSKGWMRATLLRGLVFRGEIERVCFNRSFSSSSVVRLVATDAWGSCVIELCVDERDFGLWVDAFSAWSTLSSLTGSSFSTMPIFFPIQRNLATISSCIRSKHMANMAMPNST